MADDNLELASAAGKYWSAEGYTPGRILRKVDYAAASKGVHPSLQGIRIVDCDTHITDAPDLFTSRGPARLKNKVPVGYEKSVRKKVLETNAAKLYNLPF